MEEENNKTTAFCPNCGQEYTIDEDIFCRKCGYNFSKNIHKKPYKIILKILLSLLTLFIIGGIIFAIIIENNIQQAIRPYTYNTKFGDTDCTISTKYNRETKSISVHLNTSEKIEKWQIAYLNNTEVMLDLIIKYGSYAKNLKGQNIVFAQGENLQADYYLNNQSVDEYVQFKHSIMYGDILINTYEALSMSIAERNKIKKAEEERQRKIRESEQQIDALSSLSSMMFMGALGF